jgi:hypothetical protein
MQLRDAQSTNVEENDGRIPSGGGLFGKKLDACDGLRRKGDRETAQQLLAKSIEGTTGGSSDARQGRTVGRTVKRQ